jgi:hypothetical protein
MASTRLICSALSTLVLAGCTGTPRDPGHSDRLADCFEIFPSEPGNVSGYHVNPTRYELDAVEVGQPIEISVGYYNFCDDPDPVVLEAGWLEGSLSGGSFEVVRVPDEVNWSTSQSMVELRLTPGAAGEHDATFRMRFAHGYYDIVLHATAVEPVAP